MPCDYTTTLCLKFTGQSVNWPDENGGIGGRSYLLQCSVAVERSEKSQFMPLLKRGKQDRIRLLCAV